MMTDKEDGMGLRITMAEVKCYLMTISEDNDDDDEDNHHDEED